MPIQLKGADELRRRLASIADLAPLARPLFTEAQRIMSESKQRVPVSTGALRSSGVVLPPEVRRREISVTLSYGDTSVDYAIHVHERLDIRHPTGQSKYLEQPLNEMEIGARKRIAAAVLKHARRSR